MAVDGCPRQRAQSADAAIQALHDFPGNIVTGGDEYHLIKPGGRIDLTARVVARVSGADFGQFPKGLRQLLDPKREGCGLVHVASPGAIMSHRNMILTFSLMVYHPAPNLSPRNEDHMPATIRKTILHGETTLIDGGRAAAKPLVLIHGVGLCAEAWGPQIAVLSRTCRAIALNLPGHHGSTMLVSGAGLGDFVAWAAGAISALGCGPVNLESPVQRWFGATAQHNACRAQVAGWLRAVAPLFHAMAYHAFATGDALFADRWGEIGCPALILTGAQDANSTADMALAMAGAAGFGHVVVVPEHRHMVNLTAPDQVTAALQDWLALPVGWRIERHSA